MAIFTHHESCPRCNSRDNLAVYDDGGKWCFGCGYVVASTLSGFVKRELTEDNIVLPDDLSTSFPPEVLNFIGQYDITIPELIQYNYYWSHDTQRLWRMFNGKTSAESRRVGKGYGPKARFYGSKEVSPITGQGTGRIVLCEDSLSSIKVGRVWPSLSLFGTSLTNTKAVKIAKDYQHVVVWLDHDKYKEGCAIASRFKWLGCTTDVLLTKHDPKCYAEIQIRQWLEKTFPNGSSSPVRPSIL